MNISCSADMDLFNDPVDAAIKLLNSLARDLDHMLSDLSYEGANTPSTSKYNNNSGVGRLIPSRGGAVNDADVMSGQKRFLQLNNNHTCLQEDNAVSSSCSELEDTPPCQMTLTERLIRCHPVWFLPGIHRSGAEHLLQGKPPGSFIVRESSKCSTMALSVRLPAGKGPHVEHFLIEVHAGKLCLETLDHRFDNISSLIAHYCTHSDELPTLLRLPDALLRAESRHQLSSLALLGQEFWQSRLSCGGISGVSSVQCGGGSAGSANSSPASSLSKPCVTSSGAGSVSSLTGVSAAGELSSFQQPRRSCEEAAAGVTLNLVPICEETADTAGGGQQRRPSTLSLTAAAAPTAALRSPALVSGVYNPPPKPPPRWSKPTPASVRTELSVLVPGGRLVRSAASTPVTAGGSAAVCWPPGRRSPVTTPASCDDDLISSHQQQRRRRARRKRSAHYQEADILESAGCCRSALADKISDYEDIWASPPRDLVAPSLPGSSSFKPRTPARSLNDLTQTDVMARISQDRERRAEQLHAQRRRARPLHGSATSVTRSSPLYAVPADAVQAAAPSRRAVPFQRRAVHRHSEPNIRWEPPGRGPPLPTIHQAVPVQPPRVQPLEYEADTEDAGEEHEMPRRRRLEPEEPSRRLEQDDSTRRREDSEEPPELTRDEQSRLVQEIVRQSMCLAAGDAPSEYDNVCCRPPPEPPAAAAGDPSKWESIVRLMTDQLRLRTGQFDESCVGAVSVGTGAGGGFTDSESFVNVGPETLLTDEEDSRPDACRRTSAAAHHQHEDPVYSAPRLNTIRLHRESRQTGPCIRDYVLQLAADDSNTFSLSIYNFIQCTREGSATELQVVMRNMRQFINGMKNYLVKHGEGDFHSVVLRERDKLSCTEFLNLDAILEGVLEELLVLPLHSFLLQLWSRDHQLLHQLPAAQLLGPAAAPSADTLHSVRQQLQRMEATLSPLDKLETLLQTVSTLFCGQQLPADQLLPLLLYCLVDCQVNHIEFECEYMLGLVHPLLLDGEAGYYLAMLSSAVHVMKNMLEIGRPDGTSPSLSPVTDSTHNSTQTDTVCSGTLESVLRVLVPDESCGTILTRTLPTRPDMSSRQVCQMLAHRLRITSPQDYGLFQLVDGHETLLADSDLPQQMKHNQRVKQQHCMIAYKRLDAKIAWPTAQIL